MQKSSKVESSVRRRVPLSRYLLFGSVALIGCLLDLATKAWVFSWLGPPDGEGATWWLVPEYVGIQTSLNTGALFGLGKDRVLYLAIFSCFALVGIVYWFVVAKAGNDLLLTWILGLITAGILGNLYDRLGLWSPMTPGGQKIHAVRDWILFQYSSDLVWPNFNLADSFLVCGAGMLLLFSFLAPADDKSIESHATANRA